jgi:hypothetical protein
MKMFPQPLPWLFLAILGCWHGDSPPGTSQPSESGGLTDPTRAVGAGSERVGCWWGTTAGGPYVPKALQPGQNFYHSDYERYRDYGALSYRVTEDTYRTTPGRELIERSLRQCVTDYRDFYHQGCIMTYRDITRPGDMGTRTVEEFFTPKQILIVVIYYSGKDLSAAEQAAGRSTLHFGALAVMDADEVFAPEADLSAVVRGAAYYTDDVGDCGAMINGELASTTDVFECIAKRLNDRQPDVPQ